MDEKTKSGAANLVALLRSEENRACEELGGAQAKGEFDFSPVSRARSTGAAGPESWGENKSVGAALADKEPAATADFEEDGELDASAWDWDDADFAEIKAPSRRRAPASRSTRASPSMARGAIFQEPASFLLTTRPPIEGREPVAQQSAEQERQERKDPLTPEQRSALMAKVKSAKTKPEIALRDALRQAGLAGYRLAPKTLPGKPDFAFGKARVAVFVDGCFWHGCSSCYRAPKGNQEYWSDKKERNMARDLRVNEELEARGWLPVRFWEHELRAEGAREAAERVQLLIGQRLAEAKTRKTGQ